MSEGGTRTREGLSAWPFIPLLFAVIAVVVIAVGWFYLMTASLTLIFTGGLAILGTIAIALYVLLGVWVYRDANRIGVPAVPWVLVVLFLFVLGLAVYLLMREFRPQR